MNSERRHIELSPRAVRDLRRLERRRRQRVAEALEQLVAVPPPGNLNIRALAGHAPWLRLRVGDFRVLYRPLSEREQAELVLRRGTLEGTPAFLVERIVNRRDLERAVRTLDVPEVD